MLEKEKFFPLNQDEINQRRNDLGFKHEDFIIHHHSSMRKIKCPEIILETAKNVSELIPESCILIMTGPVPIEEIKLFNCNLVEINHKVFKYRTDIGKLTVFWTGVSSEVEYLLQISNVELNTSLHDSFNISLMEALACGIPVVTSDVVGISEHIRISDSGFCFPTKKLNFDELNKTLLSNDSKRKLFDIDYTVNAIIQLARDKNLAKKMGSSGANYVAETFDFSKAFNVFNKYLNE